MEEEIVKLARKWLEAVQVVCGLRLKSKNYTDNLHQLTFVDRDGVEHLVVMNNEFSIKDYKKGEHIPAKEKEIKIRLKTTPSPVIVEQKKEGEKRELNELEIVEGAKKWLEENLGIYGLLNEIPVRTGSLYEVIFKDRKGNKKAKVIVTLMGEIRKYEPL